MYLLLNDVVKMAAQTGENLFNISPDTVYGSLLGLLFLAVVMLAYGFIKTMKHIYSNDIKAAQNQEKLIAVLDKQAETLDEITSSFTDSMRLIEKHTSILERYLQKHNV